MIRSSSMTNLTGPEHTSKATVTDSIIGAVTNVCPRCFEGKVFSGVFSMHKDCPHCGLHYEREPGYFLGAMSLSYAMGFIVILPIFLTLLLKDAPMAWVIGAPAAVIISIAPITFRLSRLIWLHFDFRVHPPANG